METLKMIGSWASAVIAIFSCITLIIKPFRHALADWIKKTSGTKEKDEALDSLKKDIRALANCFSNYEEDYRLLKEALEKTSEVDKSVLRSNITSIYYEHLEAKRVPLYVRENLIYMSDVYNKLGGNSFINTIVKDMLSWEPYE